MTNFKRTILIILMIIIMVIVVLEAVTILNKNTKSELDIFYDDEITNEYEDIRNLSKEYNVYNAQVDKCFVVGAMVHNEYIYGEFLEDYKKERDSFLRIVCNTKNNDLIIFDIMYKNNTKEFKLVSDYTRDTSKKEEDRIIKLSKYKNISEYEYKGYTYLVLYNGILNDENFNSENVFKLVKLY